MVIMNNPWNDAKKLFLIRNSPCGLYRGETLDKGVNYFILALEKFGCITEYSCEGHFNRKHQIPELYISFVVPDKKTIKHIKKILLKPCILYHEYKNTYTLRINFKSREHKKKILTKLSKLWEKYYNENF